MYSAGTSYRTAMLYCITGGSTFSGETENEFNLLSLFQ